MVDYVLGPCKNTGTETINFENCKEENTKIAINNVLVGKSGVAVGVEFILIQNFT